MIQVLSVSVYALNDVNNGKMGSEFSVAIVAWEKPSAPCMVVAGSSRYTVVIQGRWLTDEVYYGCGVIFLLCLEP